MIHRLALVDDGVEIHGSTRVFAFSHVQLGAIVGQKVSIGEQCFIEKGSKIGDGVTIKNGVSVWAGVTIGRGAFIGPAVVFTNDRYPRSARWVGEKEDWLIETVVEEGASIGAGAIILPGKRIGKYAMVAAGSIVTENVPPYALVKGSPARVSGVVDESGRPLP